jgi:hypothetical protein
MAKKRYWGLGDKMTVAEAHAVIIAWTVMVRDLISTGLFEAWLERSAKDEQEVAMRDAAIMVGRYSRLLLANLDPMLKEVAAEVGTEVIIRDVIIPMNDWKSGLLLLPKPEEGLSRLIGDLAAMEKLMRGTQTH